MGWEPNTPTPHTDSLPSKVIPLRHGGVLKTWSEVKLQIAIEAKVLVIEWPWLILGIVWQQVHNMGHNFVYFLEGMFFKSDVKKLALTDMGFKLFAGYPEHLFWITEVIVYSMLAMMTILCLGRVVVNFQSYTSYPTPGLVIAKRMLMTMTACQTLRIISFCITLLPSPAHHCQPGGHWKPPRNAYEIIMTFDATYGCGDLIFSSHVIIGMMTTMVIFTYYPYAWLQAGITCIQALFSLLVIAGRRHYSIDVFTAVYVVPLVWFFLSHKIPDPTSLDCYGISCTSHHIIIGDCLYQYPGGSALATGGEETPSPGDGDVYRGILPANGARSDVDVEVGRISEDSRIALTKRLSRGAESNGAAS